jgi:hypothetical protein
VSLLADAFSVLAQFLQPDRGPDQSGDFRVNPNLFFAMFGLGFLLGTLGHLFKSKLLVATGIALVMLATFLIPVVLQAAN